MQEAYKILVVDDEPDLEPLMLQRMRRDIRAGRYKFVFAQNGVEALERLHQDNDIDMVLSDINMPQMERSHPAGADTQGRPQHPVGDNFGLWRYEKHTHGHEPRRIRLRHQTLRF